MYACVYLIVCMCVRVRVSFVCMMHVCWLVYMMLCGYVRFGECAGKTVQSLAFLCYLAEVKDLWGPFLVVCPNSTLHQWQEETRTFAPQLRVTRAFRRRLLLLRFFFSSSLPPLPLLLFLSSPSSSSSPPLLPPLPLLLSFSHCLHFFLLRVALSLFCSYACRVHHFSHTLFAAHCCHFPGASVLGQSLRA